MSWICEFCSTANEESARECFVCGQPRSAASLRAARERERAERAARLQAQAGKWLNGSFVGAVAVAGIAAGILLAQLVFTGGLDQVFFRLGMMLDRMLGNLSALLGLPGLLGSLSRSAAREMAGNGAAVWDHWGRNLALGVMTLEVLARTRVLPGLSVLGEKLGWLCQRVLEGAGRLLDRLGLLCQKAWNAILGVLRAVFGFLDRLLF